MSQKGTTICAPATRDGGAIAIIRISGPDAIGIVNKLFKPADNQIDLQSAKGYSLIFGSLHSADEFLDEVIISLFRAPLSYTGEDMVEISCHASHYIRGKIMELLITSGAVPANAGEFTMRAFMNGKMDLSQAEAVADIIASDSEAAHRLAATQLRGGFSAEIEKLREELLHFAALIELELDFSEEDVEFADRFRMTETIIRIRNLVDTLASSFRLGNAIKKGIPVVIAGRPNVGKSSLLNVLLQEERAIVSEIPGTTRDTVEEVIHLGGLSFRFIDTAGLRKEEVEDKVEARGIERTLLKLSQAEVVLAVTEATDSPEEIITFYNAVKDTQAASGSKIIAVINKTDLLTTGQTGSLREILTESGGFVPIFVSARESVGIEDMRQHLIKSVETEGLRSPQLIVTNARHWHSLINVSASLERALEGFRNGIPTELIATDIRHAIHYLGEITGKITGDEILGDIFKNFCIGK